MGFVLINPFDLSRIIYSLHLIYKNRASPDNVHTKPASGWALFMNYQRRDVKTSCLPLAEIPQAGKSVSYFGWRVKPIYLGADKKMNSFNNS